MTEHKNATAAADCQAPVALTEAGWQAIAEDWLRLAVLALPHLHRLEQHGVKAAGELAREIDARLLAGAAQEMTR